MILLLVPSLYGLCTLTLNEFSKLQSLNHVLDTNLQQSAMQLNSTITDSDGQIIREIYQTENRKYIKDADIPQILKDIYVVSEDQHFYSHKGFDLSAISRAFIINTGSGGSTLFLIQIFSEKSQISR